jgi:hypothetical protein
VEVPEHFALEDSDLESKRSWVSSLTIGFIAAISSFGTPAQEPKHDGPTSEKSAAAQKKTQWIVDTLFAGIGQNQPLCRNLLKYLNGYQGCPGGYFSTFPGFSSPPWQELDPKEHLDLIWRLLMYRARADRYFQRGLWAKSPSILDNPGDRRAATDFIARGGKLRVWRTRLFDDYGAGQPAPAGEQTVVELRQSLNYNPKAPDPCYDNPQFWQGSTYIVTSDLKGPDPSVPGPIADLLQAGSLMMYQKIPYFLARGDVSRMQTAAHLPHSFPPFYYCRFRQGDE